jgi:hypothetical protein
LVALNKSLIPFKARSQLFDSLASMDQNAKRISGCYFFNTNDSLDSTILLLSLVPHIFNDYSASHNNSLAPKCNIVNNVNI